MKITRAYLEQHPAHVFVFGDNLFNYGKGGAAELRDMPNAYGFVTKYRPCNDDKCFFKPIEYRQVYQSQVIVLRRIITTCPDCTFLISKVGSGLANRFKIFETIIEPNLKYDLRKFENVRFLW